jgi:hypothetical protein
MHRVAMPVTAFPARGARLLYNAMVVARHFAGRPAL